MKTKELKAILDGHAKWVREEAGGTRANLEGANLRGANLEGADLRDANLSNANLVDANLRHAYLNHANLVDANLRNANLSNATFRGANLVGADLRHADLVGANLSNADLSNANLSNADLSNANLSDANLVGAIDAQYVSAQSSILPESGPIWGWKKCRNDVLVKLVVGNTAKRSHATGRKCRAEHVKVLEVIGAEIGISHHDENTHYKVGHIVRCDKWNEDRWIECGGGIHFFLTRIEAERYSY